MVAISGTSFLRNSERCLQLSWKRKLRGAGRMSRGGARCKRRSWSEHKDARLGAALAYYSIFSLGPLIVIAITIAGLVLGGEAVASLS
jgi:hypothetical protein